MEHRSEATIWYLPFASLHMFVRLITFATEKPAFLSQLSFKH